MLLQTTLKMQEPNIGNINFSFVVLFVFFFSCSQEPIPINYNHDQCDFCKMMISDPRYGAEIVTEKGKIYKFDSIECMPAFLRQVQMTNVNILSFWVVDFNTPQKLINAYKAVYLHSKNLRSPMGLNLTAVNNQEAAQNLQSRYQGQIISWAEVQLIVQENWINKTP